MRKWQEIKWSSMVYEYKDKANQRSYIKKLFEEIY